MAVGSGLLCANRTTPMNPTRVLIVEDEENERTGLAELVSTWGYKTETACDGVEGLEKIASFAPSIILTDLKMPGMSGIDLLRRVKEEYPEVIVVMVTAYGTIESAVEAMRLGAYDYIIKPVNSEALNLIVSRALEHHRLREEVKNLRSVIDRKYGFENIIGKSKNLLACSTMLRVRLKATPPCLCVGRPARARNSWRRPSTSIVPVGTGPSS